MSAKYDLKHKKHPKILRPQIRKNYDVKKSAYMRLTSDPRSGLRGGSECALCGAGPISFRFYIL